MKGKFRFKNLIIIVLCMFFVFGFIKQQSAMNRIKKETKEKTEKLQQVKEENEKLTVLIDLFGQETPVEVDLLQVSKM